MLGKCQHCPGVKEFCPSEENKGGMCAWMEGKDTLKTEIKGTFYDCFKELQLKTPEFLKHTLIKRKQADTFKKMRDNVKENSVLIQMDFSENYTCIEQNEIQ